MHVDTLFYVIKLNPKHPIKVQHRLQITMRELYVYVIVPLNGLI